MANPEFKTLQNPENLPADARALGLQASSSEPEGRVEIAGAWARKKLAQGPSVLPSLPVSYRTLLLAVVGLLGVGVLGRRYFR